MNKIKKILITDDEEDVITYLSTLLKDNGFEIEIANNGKECVKKAGEILPDLITLDISMPEESGSKALRELQENDATKDIPVIIITGVDSAYKNFIHTRRQLTPPQAYFEKPIKREEFLEKVFELIKQN